MSKVIASDTSNISSISENDFSQGIIQGNPLSSSTVNAFMNEISKNRFLSYQEGKTYKKDDIILKDGVFYICVKESNVFNVENFSRIVVKKSGEEEIVYETPFIEGFRVTTPGDFWLEGLNKSGIPVFLMKFITSSNSLSPKVFIYFLSEPSVGVKTYAVKYNNGEVKTFFILEGLKHKIEKIRSNCPDIKDTDGYSYSYVEAATYFYYIRAGW